MCLLLTTPKKQNFYLVETEGKYKMLTVNNNQKDKTLNTKKQNSGLDYQDIPTKSATDVAQNVSESDKEGTIASESPGASKPPGGSLDECQACSPGGGWGPWSSCYEDIPGARAIREKTCVNKESQGEQRDPVREGRLFVILFYLQLCALRAVVPDTPKAWN